MYTIARTLCFLALVLLSGCVAIADGRRGIPLLFVAEASGKISALEIDGGDGSLRPSWSMTAGAPLSFLAFHPTEPLLYATVGDRLQGHSMVSGEGPLGEVTVGARGTHVELDRTGKFAFVASYGGNRMVLVPLGDDGAPLSPTAVLGGGGAADDYRKAHQVRVHPSNRFVYVPCLGSDHIAVHSFDADTGALAVLPPAKLPAGTGPRHMDFHPSVDVAYVLGELASTVTVLRIDPDTGALETVQSLSTLPDGVTEPSRSSDVHVTPDGRFLYAINREPRNDIAMFAIEADGGLAPMGHVATGGDHARTFVIEPSGRFLYVGNSNSKNVTAFEIGPDGQLARIWGGQKLTERILFVGVRAL